jgi:hypothetical protein
MDLRVRRQQKTGRGFISRNLMTYVTGVIKSVRMSWAGHVDIWAGAELRKGFVWKPEGK